MYAPYLVGAGNLSRIMIIKRSFTHTVKRAHRLWFPLAALFVALLLPAAQAQEGTDAPEDDEITELEPLVVTGDLLLKREDRLPASNTLLGEGALDKAGNKHFQDVLKQVPNINWAGGTSRPRFFQIRGIGANSQFGNEIPATSVGFLIDGIDFTGMGSIASLFDVDQVEVLRGPQAAAFGANAMAGMILLRSKEPTPYFTGKFEAEVGNYDLRRAGAALGGPIGDFNNSGLSFRVSAEKLYHNGYRKNHYLDRDDTNERDETTGRLKLNWEATPKLNFQITTLIADFDNGYDVWSLDNDSYNTTTDEPGKDAQQTKALSLRSTLNIKENLDLIYLGSASDSDILYSYDWDWSNPEELEELYGPEIYHGTDVTDRERDIHTHDLRLRSLSNEQRTGIQSWATGLYYKDFQEKQVYFDVNSAYETSSFAGYAQTEWGLNDHLSLEFAGRIEESSIDYRDEFGTHLDNDETLWGGKTALRWTPSATDRFYLSVDRGFKMGGVNMDDEVPGEFRVYDTETLWNYELGWRAFRQNGRFNSNLSVFYMNRKDMQVDSSIQTGDGNTFALYKDNAASGTNYGIEWDLSWNVNDIWSFFGSLGYLKAEFDDYTYVDPSDNTSIINLDGSEQGYAPTYTYRAGTEVALNNGLFGEISVHGRDAYLFHFTSGSELDGYNLVDLRLGYDKGNWRLTFWVNNLLDNHYDVRGFYFANEPPAYDDPQVWLTQGDRRQLGATLRYRF